VRFETAGRELFRQQPRLTGKYVVMYSGNHSAVHPLDTSMPAAENCGQMSPSSFVSLKFKRA
jgi:hypothetical protein